MDDKKIINPVARETLQQKVYENLKMLILDGAISPGTKLNETHVAKQMNTSATPVREAFRMLAAEGFVKMEPWKGVVVQEYKPCEIKDVFECREALEILGLELTVKRICESPNSSELLKKLDKEIEKSENSSDLTEFVASNSEIHNFWISGSGNERLAVLMESLNDLLLHDRYVSGMDEERRKQIIKEHTDILKAIRACDIESAKKFLKLHIRNGYLYSMEQKK